MILTNNLKSYPKGYLTISGPIKVLATQALAGKIKVLDTVQL